MYSWRMSALCVVRIDHDSIDTYASQGESKIMGCSGFTDESLNVGLGSLYVDCAGGCRMFFAE